MYKNEIIIAAFVAWLPATAILFRMKGPRLAVVAAVLGGLLLLPRDSAILPVFGIFAINKRTVTGVSILLGILLFDWRTLLRARPKLVDLPMIAFVMEPLVSLAMNRFADSLDALAIVWGNFAEWSIPYLAGRLYFGTRDSAQYLSSAIVVAGLLSVPIYAFEAVLGPDYYLARLVYGIKFHSHMVLRLGGWRPEGFQTNGLEVATWLALATTVSTWLWLRGGSRFKGIPPWAPPLVLGIAAIASRGIFGYATLFIGLAVVGLTQLTRTRVIMIALAIIPLFYIGGRIDGKWDGQALVNIATRAGRSDTISYRLRAEDSYLKKVFEHGAVFGFGGTNSAIFDWYSQSHLWPDGWWIHQIRSGGLVGLVVFFAALFLVPALLGLTLPAGRSGRDSPGSLAWGLALFVILHMNDCLLNISFMTPTALIGGSLVSLFLNRRSIRPELATIAGALQQRLPVGRDSALATAIALIVMEVFGQISGASTLGVFSSMGAHTPFLFLWAWAAASPTLFRFLPGRDAAIACLVAGWALLPVTSYPPTNLADPPVADAPVAASVHAVAVPTPLLVNKATAIGLGCLVGLVLFDRRAFEQLRFHAVDLPMIAWCLIPTASSAWNGLSLFEGLAQSRYLAITWGVPYLMGRIYLVDRESMVRFAIGLAAGGLAYLPICLLEYIEGPMVYRLVFGPQPYEFEGAVRSFGFRPLGFMEHGNQLGMWMANSAVAATWLRASGASKKPGGLPGMVLATLLIGLTLLCQSSSSIVLMVLALLPLVVGRLFQGRLRCRTIVGAIAGLVILMALFLASMRGFDLSSLRNEARNFFLGIQKTSFTWRLARTEQYLPIATLRPWLGWGRADWNLEGHLFINPVNFPLWLLTLGMYGSCGLVALTAIWVLPLARAIWRRQNSWLGPSGGATGTLVALVVINFLDTFSNSVVILPILAAIGGLNRPSADRNSST